MKMNKMYLNECLEFGAQGCKNNIENNIEIISNLIINWGKN